MFVLDPFQTSVHVYNYLLCVDRHAENCRIIEFGAQLHDDTWLVIGIHRNTSLQPFA